MLHIVYLCECVCMQNVCMCTAVVLPMLSVFMGLFHWTAGPAPNVWDVFQPKYTEWLQQHLESRAVESLEM